MMKNCKETLLGGGRKLVSLMLCALTATACTDTLDEAALPKPLSVDVNARDITARAPIHGTALPDASSIGISLLAEDGTPYDGVTYANLKYTASGTAPDQTWSTPNIPTLSSTPAKLVAYYPWADGTDYTAVPVETSTQTDYMYSKWLTGLSNANPNASIVMQHALTAVRVALVKGDFTADVDVSSVSVKSPAFATAGSLDATTGALSGLTGTGEAVTVTADFPLTAQATNVEVMAVPDVSVAAGVTTVTTQIGDRKYSVNINFTESYKQGYIYTYTLTLNNTGMEVTSVAVTPWQEGMTENGDLTVEEPDNKYIVKIEVPEGSFQFEHNILNFTGTIDWGDGQVSTYDQPIDNPFHKYVTAGEYTVAARGNATGLFSPFDLMPAALDSRADIKGSKHIITQIIHIGGDMGITDMCQAFACQTKLTEIPADVFDRLEGVIALPYTFAYCTGLTEIPEGLFDNCLKTIGYWSEYYYGLCCTFEGCTALTSIPQGLFDKCTEMTRFDGTFMSCTGITEIPEGLFDKCTEVTEFNGTFNSCYELTSIPQGLFDNCTEVTSFIYTFAECESITEIPQGLFDNCTQAVTFNGTFNGCAALKSIPAGLFDNCPEVTNFGYTFGGCIGITEIPEDLFRYNIEAKKFNTTFSRCIGLTEIPQGLFDNCTEVTDFYGAFNGCTALTSIPTGLFDKCTKVTSFSSTFGMCTGLTNIPQGLFDKCPEVTSFQGVFQYCPALTSIPVGLFDNNIKVTDAGYIFGWSGITEVPEGLFDKCPDIEYFSGLFAECKNLKSLPVNLFDFNKKAKNFYQAFRDCTALTGESPYTIINVDGTDVKVHLYERSSYPEHFTAPTSYNKAYYSCTGLTDYADIPGSWK